MAIVVEREQRELHPTHAVAAIGALGWLAIAGAASLGAGAVHAAAIGVHSEHRQAVITFAIVAAVQLGFGAVALARPGRVVLTLGAVANVVFVGGWVLAKTKGISFIDGLDVADAADDRFVHRVDRSITRDVLVGCRPPARASGSSPTSLSPAR